MEKIYEPPCNLQICVSRELSEEEFDVLSETLDEYIGDYVTDDDIIQHTVYHRDLGQEIVCYMFTLDEHLVNAEYGAYIGDELSSVVDQIMPADVYWELELTLEDQEIEINSNDNEYTVFESVQDQLKKLVKG